MDTAKNAIVTAIQRMSCIITPHVVSKKSAEQNHRFCWELEVCGGYHRVPLRGLAQTNPGALRRTVWSASNCESGNFAPAFFASFRPPVKARSGTKARIRQLAHRRRQLLSASNQEGSGPKRCSFFGHPDRQDQISTRCSTIRDQPRLLNTSDR